MAAATHDLRPALAGSVGLHLALAALALITWPNFSKPLPTGPVTVKLVAHSPTPDIRPGVEAPEPTPPATPEPDPAAAAPEPVQEVPTPPAPVPKPAPSPTPKPLDLDALAKPLPKRQPALDLNALAKPLPKPRPALDLNALAANTPRRPANAQRGAARPETAVEARTALGAGQGLSADEASLLAAKLNRLWNPNCGAEGAADVLVKVNMRLTQGGGLAAPPTVVGPQSNNPVWQAAAQRALSAVARGAPYDELPRDRYAVWKDINFNFDGRQACRG